MNMVLIGPNLQKLQLIPSLKGQTDLLENTVNGLVEDSTTILRRKNQMIEKNGDVVALMNILTHPATLRPKGRGMDPKRFKDVLTPEEIWKVIAFMRAGFPEGGATK